MQERVLLESKTKFSFLSYLVQSFLKCSLLHTPFYTISIEKKHKILYICVFQRKDKEFDSSFNLTATKI